MNTHYLTAPAQLEDLLAQDAEQELFFSLGKCLAVSLKRNTSQQRRNFTPQNETYLWIKEMDAGLPLFGEGITLKQMFHGNEEIMEELQDYLANIATADSPEFRDPVMEKVTAQFMYCMEKKSAFLSSIAAFHTSERENACHNSLQKAVHNLTDQIAKIHNFTYYQRIFEPPQWYMQMTQGFIRMSDALLGRRISRAHQMNIDQLALRYLGWSVVENAARKFQEELSADITFFPNESFTARIEEISRFYGELSTQAGYMKQRIKRLSGELTGYFAFHGIAPKRHDLEISEKKLLEF